MSISRAACTRFVLPGLLVAMMATPVFSQRAALSEGDSALIARILLAEDAREADALALHEGERHADARVRALAMRARERIIDPVFARRDSLPPVPSLAALPPHPEPAWRLRYRALAAQRTNCSALHAALSDSAWPVRLRALGLVSAACAEHAELQAAIVAMIDALPDEAATRRAGEASWHGAAHALVALARTRPRDAAPRIARLATHNQPEVREYAVRAAVVLSDTTRLLQLTRDVSPNVQAMAVDAVRRLTVRAHDTLYLRLLDGGAPQVVRSAALALVGSTHPTAATTARAMYTRWLNYGNASFRDVRHALLQAAGRDTTADVGVMPRVVLPPLTVALALGASVHVRVAMSEASGGGEFEVRMRGDVAPIMAAHILQLVDRRYYDGLTWHRVEHDFVVQGGSPGANEYVGLHHFLRDALGTVPHARGTIGMSTRGHDTGDAQWFINVRDNLRLGRDYTIFAEVTRGMDVVDGILEGDTIASMRVVQ